MHKKDFNSWNERKKQLDSILKRPFFHEREIWFCHLGANIGFEQDGRGKEYLRPIAIARQFNNEVFWAIPLSKTKKKNLYYFDFSFKKGPISVAILSQIKLLDAKRLSHHVGEISRADFAKLKEKLKADRKSTRLN